MTHLSDIDRSISELLRRDLPVPEHRDGWREGVLARIAAEAPPPTRPARTARPHAWLPTWMRAWTSKLRRPARARLEADAVFELEAPRNHRRPRVAVVVGFTCVAIAMVAAATVWGVEAIRELRRPGFVLLITDDVAPGFAGDDGSATSRPIEPPNLLWKFEADGALYSTPAVAGGTVYVGSEDGHLYAVSAETGHEKWKLDIDMNPRSAPAVAHGMVYVGSDDAHLYAVDAESGAVRWKFRTYGAVESSPMVSGDAVYFGSGDGRFYSVDAQTGRERWRLMTGFQSISSPAVSKGVVYFDVARGISDDRDAAYLYAVDAETGMVNWKLRTSGGWACSPVVSEGFVYVAGGGSLYAVNASTGAQVWRFSASHIEANVHFSGRPVVWDGLVYAGAGFQGYLFAVDVESGAREWFSDDGGSDPIVRGGLVYVGGTWNDKLHALDAKTGREHWTFDAGACILHTPVLSDGVFYISSQDGLLLAVK